jgi:hypothetical protein
VRSPNHVQSRVCKDSCPHPLQRERKGQVSLMATEPGQYHAKGQGPVLVKQRPKQGPIGVQWAWRDQPGQREMVVRLVEPPLICVGEVMSKNVVKKHHGQVSEHPIPRGGGGREAHRRQGRQEEVSRKDCWEQCRGSAFAEERVVGRPAEDIDVIGLGWRGSQKKKAGSILATVGRRMKEVDRHGIELD